jgi:hypothetical protein
MMMDNSLPGGINVDTATKIQIANNVRKTRKVFLGCCKGEKTDSGVTMAPTAIVDTIAIAAFGLAVLSIMMSNLLVVEIAGGFLVFFAPYMVVQKRILAKLGTFRSLLNQLRMQVNEFMVQNDILSANVTRLHGSVNELELVEEELSALANTDNVDRLVYVVKETKRINALMMKNTQSAIVQQLITTVIRTDRDLDLKIGPHELRNLMSRLQVQPGFDFHEDRFLAMLGNTDEPVPIEKIMDVVRNLKCDEIPEEENIFTMRPEQLTKKVMDTTSSPNKQSPRRGIFGIRKPNADIFRIQVA